MKSYTRRFQGFLCLSMGLALAFGPYPGIRSTQQTVNAVYVSAVGLTDHAFRPACPKKPVLIDAQDLEKFPKIKKALESPALSILERTEMSLYGGKISQFTQQLTGQEQTNFCFEYNARTYALERTLIHELGMIHLVGVKKVPEAMATIARQDLNLVPTLKSYLDSLVLAANDAATLDENTGSDFPEARREAASDSSSRDSVKIMKQAQEQFDKIGRRARAQMNQLKAHKWISLFEEKRRDFSPHEWTLLCQKIGCSVDRFCFICEGYVISGRQGTVTERVEIPVKGFNIVRYILAAIFLFLGFFTMRHVYGTRPGTRLNPIWSAVLGDCVIILFIGFGAYCLVDYLLVRFFEMKSFAPDPIVRGLCAIAYLPVTGFFSLFSANLGDQSLEIETDGVRIHYPGSERFLPWETITGLNLRETRVMVSRVGILMSRKLQTKLVIMTDENEDSLVEPGLHKTKARIIQQLKTNAPKRLQPDVDRLGREW